MSTRNFIISATIVALLITGELANGAPKGNPVFKNNGKATSEDPISVINEVLFEITTHVLQTGKLAAALVEFQGIAPNFALARTYTFDFAKDICSENNGCERVHEQIQVGGMDESNDQNPYTTIISGAFDNDAQVVFDRSNFTYKFTVPDFLFNSTDYQRISTNLNTSVQHIYSGLKLRVANSTVGITADFNLAHHFTISNLKVILELGEVTMEVPSVVKFENGSWTDLPPVEKNAAPEVMALWRDTDESGQTLEKRYSSFLEGKINDILAGSTF